MRTWLVVPILVVLAWTSTAPADADVTGPLISSVDKPPPLHHKSPAAARWLSIGGLASAALIGAGIAIYEAQPSGGTIPNRDVDAMVAVGAAGVLIAPSIAEWYSGETGGLKLRTVGLVLGLIAAGVVASSGTPCSQFGETCNGGTPISYGGAGAILIGLATSAYLGGVVYDVVEAPTAIDDYNKHQLVVVPTALPTATGMAPGLTLGGRF